MARSQNRFPELSHGEAVAALRWLVARGTIRTSHIRAALKRREGLVREIQARLAALGDDGFSLLKAKPLLPIAREGSVGRRRRRRMSPARRAQLRQHGQYLGAVRRLSKANRAKIKAIREKKGARSAIAAARKLVAR
jgi:hypothetical protein